MTEAQHKNFLKILGKFLQKEFGVAQRSQRNDTLTRLPNPLISQTPTHVPSWDILARPAE
jgi:hypothetical protein